MKIALLSSRKKVQGIIQEKDQEKALELQTLTAAQNVQIEALKAEHAKALEALQQESETRIAECKAECDKAIEDITRKCHDTIKENEAHCRFLIRAERESVLQEIENLRNLSEKELLYRLLISMSGAENSMKRIESRQESLFSDMQIDVIKMIEQLHLDAEEHRKNILLSTEQVRDQIAEQCNATRKGMGDDLAKAVESIRKRTKAIEDAVNGFKYEMSLIPDRIDAVISSTDLGRFDDRFASIEEKISGVQDSISDIDDNVSEINDAVDIRSLADVVQTIERIESVVDSINSEIDSIQSDVESVKSEVESIRYNSD